MNSKFVKAKKRRGRTKATQGKSARKLTALRYAAEGLRVAPAHTTKDGRCTCGDKDCRQPGRHLRTPNGVDGATSDPAKIEEFWSRWPNARIAIATGVAGIIALKVISEAGPAALDGGFIDSPAWPPDCR